MSGKTEVFNFLSVLRVWAVVLVTWAHLGGWWLSSKGYTSFLQTGWENIFVKPLHLFQNGGHLGVLLFFLVSGYIITHVSLRETVFEFITKRVFRIFPALAFAIFLTYVIAHSCKALGIPYPLGLGDHSLSTYISSLFLINYLSGAPAVNGVTWTLLIEIMFYAMTALLMSRTKKNPTSATYYLIALVSVIIMTASFSETNKLASYYAVYILFLLIGRSYYLGTSGLISPIESGSLIFTCMFLYICFYQYVYPGALFSPFPTYPVIYSDALAIILFMLSANICKNISKTGNFLAETSYSVYLLHLPVGGLALVILDKLGVGFEISFVISIAFCLLASYALLVAIERPSQRIARRIIGPMKTN